MKRGTALLEPWSTKEKLCLSSAVLRNGDQNWMSVSRVLRVFGEQDRPSEWYSQKQCALQYESLLNTVGTSKRKKRSEKGVEMVDSPGESIVRKLLQERFEELNRLMEEDRKEYLRVKKEMEEIESGNADDRLEEFEREMEEEKEREATRGSILRQHEERSRLESGRLTPHVEPQQPETKVPTSPLLTSLLQSPSHYRSSSSIHNLLNSPSRVKESPTLSRLLESPAKQLEPTVLFPSPVKKEQEPEEEPRASQSEPEEPVLASEIVEEELHTPESSPEKIKEESTLASDNIIIEVEKNGLDSQELSNSQVSELELEISALEADKETPNTSATKTDTEEGDAEREELEQSSLTTLPDSDTMEEQHSMSELDSQTVNMIVAGAGVISISHHISSEHMEEVVSSDIQHKDDSENAESVKEDSLDDVSDEIPETMKEGDAAVTMNIVADSCQTEVDALNNFIIGPETPKDNFVVQVHCSTPENVLEEEAKTPEVKDSVKHDNSQGAKADVVEIDEELNVEGAVLGVGGDMVNLGGAVVVEEEVDTTVHEVEVVVSDLNTDAENKSLEEEDSTQDGEMKDMVATPETEPHEESQEEDENPTPKTSSNEDNEKEDKEEEDKNQKEITMPTLLKVTEKSESPNLGEEEGDGSKRSGKKRLVSGSACSDSKPSSPAPHMLEDSKEYRAWKKSIMLVFNRLATHKYASIFLRPITNEQAPAYDTVIHRPVDLSTIKKRIETGELRTTVEFQRDLLLMFQNAIMYNNSRTRVHEMAFIMQTECMPHIELMVDAMGEGVPWQKDPVNLDKLNTRGRGETPKRKRTSLEDTKSASIIKRRKDTSI